jgi:hypothetical protein
LKCVRCRFEKGVNNIPPAHYVFAGDSLCDDCMNKNILEFKGGKQVKYD